MTKNSEASLPDARFGSIESLPDWRKSKDKDRDDDEELEETPKDVVQMLGFDPKDESRGK